MKGFNWDPAGPDERLAAACIDVRSGIVGAAREVLAETRASNDFARRGYASALLGALAARGNLPELWLRDTPRDPDALLLAARSASARAAKALRDQDSGAPRLVREAIGVIKTAALAWPQDPTPWVTMLGLIKHHQHATTNLLSVHSSTGLTGPWNLVEDGIWTRDPNNRETGRHLLDHLGPKCGGSNQSMAVIANFLAQQSPPHSPLRLLPLAARLESVQDSEAHAAEKAQRFNRIEAIRRLIAAVNCELQAVVSGTWRSDDGRMPPDPADLRARREKLTREAAHEEADLAAEPHPLPTVLRLELADLYACWFFGPRAADPQKVAGYVPVADLSLLAHGLHLAGELASAQVVLRHVFPHASPYPWRLYGDPQQVLPETLQSLARAPILRPG